MDTMGDKINARAKMIKAAPVIPGSDGEVLTIQEALKSLKRLLPCHAQGIGRWWR